MVAVGCGLWNAGGTRAARTALRGPRTHVLTVVLCCVLPRGVGITADTFKKGTKRKKEEGGEDEKPAKKPAVKGELWAFYAHMGLHNTTRLAF